VISDQKDVSNIVELRPRKSGARRGSAEDKTPHDIDISRLIDLSRYEAPTDPSDDFHAKMAINIAVLVLPVALAAAAAEIADITQPSLGAPIWVVQRETGRLGSSDIQRGDASLGAGARRLLEAASCTITAASSDNRRPRATRSCAAVRTRFT